MQEERVLRIVARSLAIAALIGAALWFAWTVRSVLVLLLVAAVLATGLSPVVDAVAGSKPERRFLRLPGPVALLILYAALIAGAVLLVLGVVPLLVRQVDDLLRQLPGYVEGLRLAARALATSYPPLQGVDEWLAEQTAGAFTGDLATQGARVLGFALSIVNGVIALVLVLVLTFYLIVDGHTVRRGVLMVLPERDRPTATAIGSRMRERIAGWMIGQLLLSTIIGVVTFVGLLLLGVPYPLLLAVIAAIGELIPMLGPVLAGVPAVIVAAFVSPVHALLTLVLYVIIQQLENHLIVPQVMRRAVDLPPFAVIVALLMGSEVLGIVGAILALPVAAAISVLVSELLALRDRDGTGEILLPNAGETTGQT